ncbi:MAG: cation:proton antiporter [Armatimonadota bacterium]|nr:cation:proton antiporter [Armatimonadota bacterium]MCX7777033.1 cation:proton antiporter [Armatimonadota bacterium]MDW8024899.1 cation:proton antiporter [Armatimonadota bacterium]
MDAAHAVNAGHTVSPVEVAAHLVLQLSVILIAAKLFAEVFERWLKQPPVLGELVAGMLIGPYALGKFLPGITGALFVPAKGIVPVSNELWSVAQIGAVILLFLIGLETDLALFLRYAGKAMLVAIGGVMFPFAFANALTVWLGYADSYFHPSALFMGAVSTATSVGITARVLSELNRLSTPEGVTILAAAVIDDVLGIIVLAIVGSLASVGRVEAEQLCVIAFKAFGVWILLTAVAIVIAPTLTRIFRLFSSEGASLVIAVSLCFLVASLMESVGLAMIIGAYALGLAFSRTEIARHLEEAVRQVAHVFVPVFFTVMGMMVDFGRMDEALVFGILLTLLAIIGKVGGCGLPAFVSGFNLLGSSRVGIGMMPRGEVALIVAGVGLAKGAINLQEFGVAIMMTFATTFLAPILLVPLFRAKGSGLRAKRERGE